MTFERHWVPLRKLILSGREATIAVLYFLASLQQITANGNGFKKAALSSLLTLKFNSPKPGTSIPAAVMSSACSR